jgi:hypothetical protein
LTTSGSLDPSSFIELSDIVPCLDPPFLFMVRHSAPDKIKMKQGCMRLSKQDKKGIETRLDQRNGFMSSLEKPDHQVCQTGPFDFHRENLCSKYCPKSIQDNF